MQYAGTPLVYWVLLNVPFTSPMIRSHARFLFLGLFFSAALTARSQERPVGFWRAHLPMNKAVGIATDGSFNCLPSNPATAAAEEQGPCNDSIGLNSWY